jgi:predicted nucleotidyltransferase component of viral defense system
VRDRLRALARSGTNEFSFFLARYALERLLYRLSKSEWRDRFVLKGAMLFAVWSHNPHRSTGDLDLLGLMPPDTRQYQAVFRELCSVPVEPDGLVFHPGSVRARRIRAQHAYQGIRVTLLATLKRIRIPLQVDVGTGDKVVPPPQKIAYPTLLDQPAPRILAYSRYSVVAEKLSAMVELGMANSRMRDYYDIWALARGFEFNGDLLRRAVSAATTHREAGMEEALPVGLSDEFADSAEKQTQWRTFLRRTVLIEHTVPLDEVVAGIRAFLEPVMSGHARGHLWRPGTGWQRKD